jgi:hypothetical protein
MRGLIRCRADVYRNHQQGEPDRIVGQYVRLAGGSPVYRYCGDNAYPMAVKIRCSIGRPLLKKPCEAPVAKQFSRV